LNIENPTS